MDERVEQFCSALSLLFGCMGGNGVIKYNVRKLVKYSDKTKAYKCGKVWRFYE